MSDFLEKMMGGEPEKKDGKVRSCTAVVVAAEDHPDLSEALNVVMFYAMNRPNGEGGGGVRQVGEKVAILMPAVEVMMLDKKTGKTEVALIGDYVVSVERVK